MKWLRQIRVRLMLWYMATIVILVVGVAIFAYVRLHRYANRYADRLLNDEATEAGAILETESREGLEDEVRAESKSRHPTYYTIYTDKGELVANTFKEPAPPFQEVKPSAGEEPVFTTETIKGEELRIIAITIHAKDPQERYVMRMGRPVKPETQLVENLTENLVMFVPGILLISIVVGWILARASLKPMQRLSDEAARITEERLHERLPVRGVGDEIDRHAEVLNKMLAGLENSFTEIKAFAARASHELRTPLTALRLHIESALHAEPAEAGAALESALGNIDRLTALVHRLLFLTRSKGEAADLKFQHVNLSELVSSVCADAALLAEQKSVRLNHSIVENAGVMGEAGLLAQLVWNLIDNAIKYSPPGEAIDVSVTRQDSQAVIAVKDSGPGIAPEDLPHIFEAFYRSNMNSDTAGFGLGLNISRWICEIHHGAIDLVNNPDRGITVTARLPMAGGN
jgi:signal transduction histidine kinase